MGTDSPHPDTDGTAERADARGVVLAPAGSGAAPGLAAAIEDRGWHLSWCTDAALAMAELCLQERSQTARAAWGLGDDDGVLLVIVPTGDAAEARMMKALVNAVRRHVPGAGVWLHHDGALVPLGGAAAPPPARPHHARDGRPSATGATPPPLPGTEADDDPEPARVTADELDMLFARDADEVSP